MNTPHDLRAQAQQLIDSGCMPSLDEVLRAATEARTRIYIHGLRRAAEKKYREEFEKIVNPAPTQLRFPFLEASR
jgi:hypothetical protein